MATILCHDCDSPIVPVKPVPMPSSDASWKELHNWHSTHKYGWTHVLPNGSMHKLLNITHPAYPSDYQTQLSKGFNLIKPKNKNLGKQFE